MASFGGIDLGNDGSAVFELTAISDDRGFACHLDDGSTVFIPPSSKYVIVRDCPTGDFDLVHREAREAANRGIDLYFCNGAPATGIAHRNGPYLIGFQNGTQSTFRLIVRAQITTRFGAKVKVEMRDSNGATVVAEPPIMPWNASLRYYRVSENSSDLYDSFRNLYLGLEALLSTVVAPQIKSDGRAEHEGKWLTRALKVVGQSVDLTPYVPASSTKATHNAIHDELYTDLRTAIFHAKADRPVWQPQDWTAREPLIKARSRYSEMFRALAIHYFNASFKSGGFVKTFWQDVNEELLKKHIVFVSDDPTQIEDEPGDDYLIAPAGGQSLLLPTTPELEMVADWRRGVRGVVVGSSLLKTVPEVRRVGTVIDDRVALIESLKAPLRIDGSDELHVVVLIEGRNYGAPNQDFES